LFRGNFGWGVGPLFPRRRAGGPARFAVAQDPGQQIDRALQPRHALTQVRHVPVGVPEEPEDRDPDPEGRLVESLVHATILLGF